MKEKGTPSIEEIKNIALDLIKQKTLTYIKSQQEAK